jgi:hypothetical protein
VPSRKGDKLQLPEYISFSSTSQKQKYARKTLKPDFRAALPAAIKLMDELFPEALKRNTHSVPPKPNKPKKPKREVVIPPVKVKVREHAERTFTFSTGETKRCCPVIGCRFGAPTGRGWIKKHTEFEAVEPVEELVEVEDDEQEEVPEVELSLGLAIPIAGEDDFGDDSQPVEVAFEEEDELALVGAKSNQIGGQVECD